MKFGIVSDLSISRAQRRLGGFESSEIVDVASEEQEINLYAVQIVRLNRSVKCYKVYLRNLILSIAKRRVDSILYSNLPHKSHDRTSITRAALRSI